jgi:uncharacterized protein YukE
MVTTFDQQPPSIAPPVSGGSGRTGGQPGQFAVEIEHQVKKLENDAKQEGVPIVGHTLEGIDNVGDGGSQAPDPFTQLFTAGFGWMIDSVSFLRDPIEKLDGDAAAVQTAVDSMKAITENLTYVAHGHREDIPTLDDWQGDAAEAHRASMKLLHEELLSLARVVEGLGTLTAVSGSMVITLRKIVRDLVATAMGSIVIIMVAAVAAAVVTLGTSVMVGVAASVAVAMAVLIESTRRITMLLDALGRQTERMGELETIAEDIANELKRFEKAAGITPSEGGNLTKRTDGSDLTKQTDGSDPQDGEGRLGKVEQPPPGPNDANPAYWNDLRDKADEKISELNDEAQRHILGDHTKLEELIKRKEEWERIRDEAEAKSEQASDTLDQQELDQAHKELGT